MQLDGVRAKFEAAGHSVSVRGDVSEVAAAWFLDCSVKTMRNWRSMRKGPPYLKLPSGVRYPIAGLFTWCEANVTRAA